MKRFVLFSGDFYYPVGGAGDYKNSFATLEEAKLIALTDHARDWWHILDLNTGKIHHDNGEIEDADNQAP